MAEATEGRADLFEHLQRHEESLSDLYLTYAEHFLIHSDFWSGLADDESRHVQWLESLGDALERDDTRLDEDRIRLAAVKTSLEYIKTLVEEARSGRVKQITALSVARDLEQSMLERRYFTAVSTDSEEVKRVLAELQRETEEHLESVLAAWENAR